jgi:hypothetical protein
MPRVARRNYSPDQDRADDGKFGEGGGSGGDGDSGGSKLPGHIKSEISKAVPGAKSVSASFDESTEKWSATVDGTKYSADIGEDTSLTFVRKGSGKGPKSFDITLPDSAFNSNHADCGCGCAGKCHDLKTWKSNLSTDQISYKKRGSDVYMVVPLVMAKAGVVMNGSLTEASELIPQGWNGRPVTVGHPTTKDGEFLSANATPETEADWAIGTLHNTTLDDSGVLRSEAWIDTQKANEIDPTLISRLKNGDQIDVSTGYFCDEEPTSGVSNGREYSVVARNLVPDHLAILPNEEGACNWADGCGVRANKRRLRNMKSKSEAALGKILKACGLDAKSKEAKKIAEAIAGIVPNARGADDDARQIVADLISNDASPFTPDDQDSLNAMSGDTLKHMADSYLKSPEDVADGGADDDKEGDTNADGDTADEDPKKDESANDDAADEEDPKKEKAMSKKEIANTVKAIVAQTLSSLITPEDRLAINTAKQITANKKAELIEKITKNSTMKKADVEKFDLAQLEVIANGLRVVEPNYSGRSVPRVNEDDSEALDMAPQSVGELVRNARKAKEATH